MLKIVLGVILFIVSLILYGMFDDWRKGGMR